jgi:hypothetical protein
MDQTYSIFWVEAEVRRLFMIYFSPPLPYPATANFNKSVSSGTFGVPPNSKAQSAAVTMVLVIKDFLIKFVLWDLRICGS